MDVHYIGEAVDLHGLGDPRRRRERPPIPSASSGEGPPICIFPPRTGGRGFFCAITADGGRGRGVAPRVGRGSLFIYICVDIYVLQSVAKYCIS